MPEEDIQIAGDKPETIDNVSKFHKHTGLGTPKIGTKYLSVDIDNSDVTRIRAYRDSSAQSVGSTAEKIELNAESFDNRKEFDNSTNYRFTATKEGYYLIYAQIYYQSTADDETQAAYIYKNGSEQARSSFPVGGVTGAKDKITNVMDLVRLNKDDYIELYGSSSTSRNALNGESYTYMFITRLI